MDPAYLRVFYDASVAAGSQMPAWEGWLAQALEWEADGKAAFWPIAVGNAVVGGAFFAGDTVHIAVLPAWHGLWANRRLRRAYDTWTHAVPIRALVKPDNRQVIRLATALGFKFQQDQGLYHLYVKEANA